MRLLPAVSLLVLISCGRNSQPEAMVNVPVFKWTAAVTTASVTDDPDDPAIWIHPSDPAQSLIIGTNKVAAPSGAIVVFDLDGKILQTIAGIDRPNNVDLRQGVRLGDQTLDLVAATERNKSALHFFAVDAASRRLRDLGARSVFEGESGERAAPMGIALYQRPSDGAVFAILSRKSGPSGSYLWEYRVEAGPTLRLVRKFGEFTGSGEIESIVSDDAVGYVYYSDEGGGVHKYYADPDQPGAANQVAFFGKAGYRGDREGLAIYATGEKTGYLISTDQIKGGSRYFLYRREDTNPEPIGVIEGGADETDGIEATSTPLGSRFPHGMLVTMNSTPKNFLLFAWPDQPR